ncbi:uncharacterized protein LOC143465863 [Clavelina lepadiformis]|uniref:uncharacterized protein LOC143465863 n=1 Tax=Clavelina lepadiformis TaxID=159417 RepID=UPI0040417F1B
MHVELQTNRSVLTTSGYREFKLVVVGPRKVGKSALVVRFLTKRFINEYVENTDMTCKGVADVDGETLRVNIQDTSEKGMRLNMIEHYFRWADAVMLVYSITDLKGFEQLRDTAMKIIEKNGEGEDRDLRRVPPMVVVGNKGDLEFVRKVTQQQGYELAGKLRSDFFETSAREGWSKMINRVPNSSGTCTPTSDTDTIHLFAGAAAAVGMAGFGYPSSPVPSRCSTPPPTQVRLPRRSFSGPGKDTDDFNVPGSTTLQRWASCNQAKSKSHSRSNSFAMAASNKNANIPLLNISAAPHSAYSSPAISEEEGDDSKRSELLFLPGVKKTPRHGSIISKLSPRLGRKINKNNNNDRSPKAYPRDNNNNKNKQLSHIASGLSAAILTSAGLSETICVPNTGIFSSSCSSSANTSSSGSVESLTSCGQGPEMKLQEQNFGGSEPFLHLCRDGLTHRSRARARSPSHLIANGLKRIRSFKNDQGRNSTNHKQSGNTLTVPVMRL